MAGQPDSSGYDLPGTGSISERSLSRHGTQFGRPRSHGCINLTPQAARWIYRWTSPVVPPREQRVYENYGTAVDIIEEYY
jgi:hypothetical protein